MTGDSPTVDLGAIDVAVLSDDTQMLALKGFTLTKPCRRTPETDPDSKANIESRRPFEATPDSEADPKDRMRRLRGQGL